MKKSSAFSCVVHVFVTELIVRRNYCEDWQPSCIMQLAVCDKIYIFCTFIVDMCLLIMKFATYVDRGF